MAVMITSSNLAFKSVKNHLFLTYQQNNGGTKRKRLVFNLLLEYTELFQTFVLKTLNTTVEFELVLTFTESRMNKINQL